MDIKNHPNILYPTMLSEICTPLFKHGINYFAIAVVNRDNRFACASTSPNLVESFFSKQYYNCGAHLCVMLQPTHSGKKSIIIDNATRIKQGASLAEELLENNSPYLIAFSEKDIDSQFFYYFGYKPNQVDPYNFYLNKKELCEKFLIYFKERLHKENDLLNLLKFTAKISGRDAGYFTTLSDEMINYKISALFPKTKNIYLLPGLSKQYLTKTHIKYIIHLNLGKTYEEIANDMNVTERTVRFHITEIKSLLNCNNLLELGRKLESIGVNKFISSEFNIEFT